MLSSARLMLKFARADRGVASIEFALIAIPFLGVVFCIAEAGLDYYALSSLDDVGRKIARQIQIGSIQEANTSSQDFGTRLCGLLSPPMTCANLAWSVQTVSSSFYSLTTSSSDANGLTQYALKQPSPDQASNKFCPGLANQYVVVQLLYAIPAITGVWMTSKVSFNGKPVRVLSTTNVFRNEAFGSVTYAGC